MKKRNISIFTLDAQEMSNFGPPSNWRFDLNSSLIRSRIVMGEEWYADSAFFDQMKLVLEADSGKPEDISNNLVYLKFPKGLNKENESFPYW